MGALREPSTGCAGGHRGVAVWGRAPLAKGWCGERGGQLAAELTAQNAGTGKLVMLFSPEASDFGEIIANTPEQLKAGGLYGQLAIEWRGGAHKWQEER